MFLLATFNLSNNFIGGLAIKKNKAIEVRSICFAIKYLFCLFSGEKFNRNKKLLIGTQ